MKQTKIRAIGIYVEPTEKQMTGAFLQMVSFSENESIVTLPSFSILMWMIPFGRIL